MPSGPLAAAIVLAIAVVIGGIYLFLELRHHGARSRDRHRVGERLPLFGTDLLVDRSGGTDRPLPRASRVPLRPTAPSSNGRGPIARPDAANGHGAPETVEFPSPRAPFGPRSTPPSARPAFGAADGGTLVATRPDTFPGGGFHEGETIRFSIPDEGTLQFLPGRLEVVGGTDRGREVRFVRTAGETRPEVTFGRSEGAAYRHVQLLARTVSRHHATMSLLDGHWQLTNVSATNPVQLNGRPLAAGEIAPLLVDGDRIEMGEVVFVFHER